MAKKKYAKGELSGKLLIYAGEKAISKDPWFCSHEISDVMKIPMTNASELVSRCHRLGLLDNNIDSPFKKGCDWSSRQHAFYRLKEIKEEQKFDGSIPLNSDTLEMLIPLMKEGESYDAALKRIISRMNEIPEDIDMKLLDSVKILVEQLKLVSQAYEKQKRLNNILLECG